MIRRAGRVALQGGRRELCADVPGIARPNSISEVDLWAIQMDARHRRNETGTIRLRKSWLSRAAAVFSQTDADELHANETAASSV